MSVVGAQRGHRSTQSNRSRLISLLLPVIATVATGLINLNTVVAKEVATSANSLLTCDVGGFPVLKISGLDSDSDSDSESENVSDLERERVSDLESDSDSDSDSDQKVEWELANLGSDTVTIESIEITWPAGNGDLESIRLHGKIYDTPLPPPFAIVESGWNPDTSKRTIRAGKTEKLELRFNQRVPDASFSDYQINVRFTQGCEVSFEVDAITDCSVGGSPVLDIKNKSVKWELFNFGFQDITLQSLALTWPLENGDLKKVKLKGTIFSELRSPPETFIDGGWEGSIDKRVIKQGKSRDLKFDFQLKHDDAMAQEYGIQAVFEQGCMLHFNFPFDELAPIVTVVDPVGGTISDPMADIVFSIEDEPAGVDPATIVVAQNGVVIGSDRYSFDGVLLTVVADPLAPWEPGSLQFYIDVADLAGNGDRYTFDFTVQGDGFRAIADCSPTTGTAPLAVRYRSRAEFDGGSIVRYRWDFEGDGVFDTSDPVAADYTRVLNSTGTFNALLEVTNNFGDLATDVCSIVVTGNPPTAVADVVPSNGPIPLDVNFSCTGSDADGSIVLYEWDFDGDGTFDFSSAVSGSTQFTYVDDGEFTAVCRVTDNEGMTALALATATVIRPGLPGSPSVTGTATPTIGFAPLTVTFNGSGSDDGSIVLWEWDFDGDGTTDFSSPTDAMASFTYQAANIFAATLTVTDDSGLQAIDNVAIEVQLNASLNLTIDSFDPSVGGVLTVETVITGGIPVRVLIVDDAENTVRTLFDGIRPAGTFADDWDGTDDAGNELPQGVYYALLEYDFAGETIIVDARDTTGGTRYNPSRSGFPNSFTPFEDDLLKVTFTIPGNRGASEVEAFVGLFNVDTRIINLLNRDAFGVGTHVVYWDGLTPQGDIAVSPPGDSFLFGIFGYTLADNGIYLSRAPTVSNLTVEPNFYDPATPNYLTPAYSLAELTFTLDEMATVQLTATNLETGVIIRTITEPNTAPGTDITVLWDGFADDGHFADEGQYRLTLQALDSTGSASLARFVLVEVQH